MKKVRILKEDGTFAQVEVGKKKEVVSESKVPTKKKVTRRKKKKVVKAEDIL